MLKNFEDSLVHSLTEVWTQVCLVAPSTLIQAFHPNCRARLLKLHPEKVLVWRTKWFVGCNVSHVVTEGTSIQRYLGYSSNLITPVWILKTAKEKQVQRLVSISVDLARQVGLMLDDISGKEMVKQKVHDDLQGSKSEIGCEERQQIVNSAKNGVRSRRGRRMQTCQIPIRPITPNNLLDSVGQYRKQRQLLPFTQTLSVLKIRMKIIPQYFLMQKGMGRIQMLHFHTPHVL